MSSRYIAETPYGHLELPKERIRSSRGGHLRAHFANQHLGLATKLSCLNDNLPIRIYNGENLIDGGLYSVTTEVKSEAETIIHFHKKASLPDD